MSKPVLKPNISVAFGLLIVQYLEDGLLEVQDIENGHLEIQDVEHRCLNVEEVEYRILRVVGVEHDILCGDELHVEVVGVVVATEKSVGT